MSETPPRCVVTVLGLALQPGGLPSPQLRDRCTYAAKVAKEEDAIIIPTGADPVGVGVTEAKVMAGLLTEAGMEESKVLLEEEALNTTGNAYHVLRMIEEERVRRGEEVVRLVVVTSRYHMPRAAWLFRVMADVLKAKVELGEAPVPVGEGGDVEGEDVRRELSILSKKPERVRSKLNKWGVECDEMEGLERPEKELREMVEAYVLAEATEKKKKEREEAKKKKGAN